jgi:hypothetical protein
MKKIIFSVAALMICGVTFGQVAGSKQATAVAPLAGAPATANAGESYQNGNDHKVQVRQAGTMQSVFTDQNDGGGLGGNLASVTQTGMVTGNTPNSGQLNLASVNQSGTANESSTWQQGDRNNARTDQGQTDDESLSNKARIQQGNANNAEDNFAYIEQDGERNQATSFQTYDNSESFIDQDGNDNEARVRQIAAPENSDGHSGFIEQDGDENGSQIRQDGEGARNVAESRQDGEGNQSKQLQTNSASAGGAVNTAISDQGSLGGGGGYISSPDAGNNSGTIASMSTNGVDLGPDVDSDNGIVFQTQTGTGDYAFARQHGNDTPNYAEQVQSGGSGNVATITQDSQQDVSTDLNYAKQVQVGSDNNVGLFQTESGNKADQRQNGSSNNALALQDGDHNLLNTKQTGASNDLFSEQYGSFDAALLVQDAGQSYFASQGATIAGANNQIDVLQQGPSGTLVQEECTFDLPMAPMPIQDVPTLTIGDICPDC